MNNPLKTLPVTGWLAVGIIAMMVGLLGAHAEDTTAVNEVLKLKDAGVADETILSYIQSKGINYGLSADDILALHNKGVSPAVLSDMVSSGGGRPEH